VLCYFFLLAIFHWKNMLVSMQMGQVTSLKEPVKTAIQIHEAFINTNCLRYYCQTMLQELKITPERLGGGIGKKFRNDMFQWCK
jgi:hypothetical protein